MVGTPGKPTRKHTPGLRIPPRPELARPAKDGGPILRSYEDEAPKFIDCATEDDAKALAKNIRMGVNWLNRHAFEAPGQHYDLRVRPKVNEYYQVDDDAVYGVHEVTRSDLDQWEKAGHKVDHFWRCEFWVHPPQDRGFRAASADSFAKAVENSAASRGVTPPETIAPRRRTVAVRRSA